jgi:hypothetical protein
MHVNRHVSTCQGTRVHLLNPLSLTPSRLPRFSANEERPFPHAFSRQKGKNMGESYISEIQFSDFPPPRFSSIFKKGKKTGVVACGAQNFFANAIGTGKFLFSRRRRK